MTGAPRIQVPESPVINHRLQQQPQQHHNALNDVCTPTEPVEQEHPDKLTADEIMGRLDALNSQLSHKLGELTKMLGKHEQFRSQIWKEIDAHKEYLLTQGTKLEDRKAKLQQHFQGFGKAVGVKFEDRFS
ncbi:hypothetical protein HDU85_007544 [Gaertneriomyces sp. JEL0708]|nr:hypothetical protein HDU85_007544 [Gaertneriomyces sp. JEL0708]